MAIPLIAVGAGAAGSALSALVVRILTWFFLAKGAAVVARTFATLGVAWFTYQWIIDPAINMADDAWGSMPAELQTWLRALGIMECASIIVSAYVLWAAKKLFLGRRSS